MDYLNEINEIWSMVKNRIQQKLGVTAMNLWFGDAEIVSYTNENVLILAVGTDFKKKIITERYMSEIEELFKEFMGFDIKIDVESKSSQPNVDDIKKQITDLQTAFFKILLYCFNFIQSGKLAVKCVNCINKHFLFPRYILIKSSSIYNNKKLMQKVT